MLRITMNYITKDVPLNSRETLQMQGGPPLTMKNVTSETNQVNGVARVWQNIHTPFYS